MALGELLISFHFLLCTMEQQYLFVCFCLDQMKQSVWILALPWTSWVTLLKSQVAFTGTPNSEAVLRISSWRALTTVAGTWQVFIIFHCHFLFVKLTVNSQKLGSWDNNGRELKTWFNNIECGMVRGPTESSVLSLVLLSLHGLSVGEKLGSRWRRGAIAVLENTDGGERATQQVCATCEPPKLA